MKTEETNLNQTSTLRCKLFGHKFIDLFNHSIEPLAPHVIQNTLIAIVNGTTTYEIEEDLQHKVSLNKEEKTYVKTYCKYCGLTL